MSRSVLVAAWLVLLLTVGLAPASAAPDLTTTLNRLKRERGAEGRMRLVRRLGSFEGDRAARALADLVRKDPSAGVRIEAARALGRLRADGATALLVELVRGGGPHAVRAAVGEALGRRDDGLVRVQKALIGRSSRLDRGLLLRALGRFRDEGSLDTLRTWRQATDDVLAAQAIRALLDRAQVKEYRRALVRDLLTTERSIERLMPALDAADTVLDRSLRRALRRAATFLEPAIKESAEHLLGQIEALPAAIPAGPPEAAPKADEERYAPPEPDVPPDGPPPPPAHRGRVDTVYVLDATGSTNATLDSLKDRILDRTEVLQQAGVNVRVGVLLYRGGKARARGRVPFERFPLTYDLRALGAWLDDIKPRGVDDRGLRVGEALRAALARSAWRWSARRTVHFYADGPCGDLQTAKRAITLHYRADRTRTRFSYVIRTRSSIPPEYAVLARLGGTGVPEELR